MRPIKESILFTILKIDFLLFYKIEMIFDVPKLLLSSNLQAVTPKIAKTAFLKNRRCNRQANSEQKKSPEIRAKKNAGNKSGVMFSR